ncbi:MAG: PilN domain-containing protein [Candidatus Omnitrophota bacterium]
MFKAVTQKLNHLKRKTGELVSLSLGNSLTIASTTASLSKKEISGIFSKNINSLNDDEISKIIKEGFTELKIKNPKIICVITSQLAITKNIEIPSTDPQEIKEIINLQAGRHTPYAREEIIVDHINIGTYKNSYTKILLVIVARAAVKRHYEILAKIGLKPEKVFFAPEALGLASSKMLKVESDNSPLSLVHVDETVTDFTVIFKRKPLFIRSIPIGIQSFELDKDKNELRFADELKKSIESYQSEGIADVPSRFILTGAIEKLSGLSEVLSNSRVPLKTTAYLGGFHLYPEALKSLSLAPRVSFLNVIAGLFFSDELKVDLVPEEVRLARALEERGRELIKIGIFVLAVFVLVFFILLSNIFFKSAYLKNLDVRYAPMIGESEKLEKDYARVSTIRHYLENRGYSLEVLTELHRLTPLEIALTDIRLDEQRKFSIKGTAEAMSVVFSFVDNMEKSSYFKDVKTKYTTKRRDGLKEFTDFEITAAIDRGEE